MSRCAVEGCERGGRIARGWCIPHYKRWRRHGDPLGGGAPRSRTRRGCAVDGCRGEHYGNGYCVVHYRRARQQGDPHTVGFRDQRIRLHVANPTYDERAEARFWANVDMGGKCWVWTGSAHLRGYGRLYYKGRAVAAHRYAWMREHGPIPDGMLVCHHCDNPPCVRLEHLFLSTPAGNSADMVRKRRAARRMGLSSSQAKLTAEQVREIRSRYDGGGISFQRLAEDYPISVMAVWKVATRRSYRDVLPLYETQEAAA